MDKPHFDPIRCLIPPYIAKKMQMQDGGKTEEDKLEERLRTHRLKSDREFFAALSPQQQHLLSVKADPPEEGKRRRIKRKPEPKIKIYTCDHKYTLPGTPIVRPKGGRFQDRDAENAYKGMYHCWKFFYELFKRDSLDNHGLVLKNSIHYGKRYGNAMWDGKQMIYGDGDGVTFKTFTADLDIIGHEIMHGLIQFTANFAYEFQPGALNEAFADIFGALIKQRVLNENVKEADWLIGSSTMLGRKYALRSLKAPGTAYIGHPVWGDDPQPATMDGYMKLKFSDEDDWGGVHWNSGIPNYAFYVAAYDMGGYAWKKAGRIWYAALMEDLRYDSTFEEAKKFTILHARKIFGKGSLEEKAVIHGWRTAKI
jgi:Zn-dependent metalloprotease